MQLLTKLRFGTSMVWAFLRLVRDPLADLSPVFRLATAISDPEYIEEVEASFSSCDHAKLAMQTQPRLGSVDLPALRGLPEGTLGREFARFLDTHQLDIHALPVKGIHDRGGYVVAHLYETHDIWHVMFGFDPSITGELGLQATYASQFPAKLPLLLIPAILLNTLLFSFEETRERMDALVLGWRLGSEAETLIGLRWNELWDVPLQTLQDRFNIRRPDSRDALTSWVPSPQLASRALGMPHRGAQAV